MVGIFGYTTKQVVEVSGEGTKTAIDVTANTATSAVNAVQDTTEYLPPQSQTQKASAYQKQEQPDNTQNNALNQALNNAIPMKQATSDSGDYQADDSYSSLQGSGGKAGWCFIGEANGARTCAKVGENDKCMSGDIFPSQEICINPTLRP